MTLQNSDKNAASKSKGHQISQNQLLKFTPLSDNLTVVHD